MAVIEEINVASITAELCNLFNQTMNKLAQTKHEMFSLGNHIQFWNPFVHYDKDDTREKAIQVLGDKRRATVQLKIDIHHLITRCFFLSS